MIIIVLFLLPLSVHGNVVQRINSKTLRVLPNGSTTTEKPCNLGKDCGIHVFRVSLSKRPEELKGYFKVREKTKGMYVPAEGDSFQLIKEVKDNMNPEIDSKVIERIDLRDFIITPVEDPEQLETILRNDLRRETDPIPENYKPYSSRPGKEKNNNRRDKQKKSEVLITEETMPWWVLALIIVISSFAGICIAILVAYCYLTNRRPIVNKNLAVVYRRPTEYEKDLLEQQRLMSMEKERLLTEIAMQNRACRQSSNASTSSRYMQHSRRQRPFRDPFGRDHRAASRASRDSERTSRARKPPPPPPPTSQPTPIEEQNYLNEP